MTRGPDPNKMGTYRNVVTGKGPTGVQYIFVPYSVKPDLCTHGKAHEGSTMGGKKGRRNNKLTEPV